MFKALDGMTGPIGLMTKNVVKAGTKVNDLTKKMKEGFSAVGKVAKPIAVGIGAIGAAAGAAAIGIFKLTEAVSTAGDEVAKTARYLGMSTDAFQEFRYIGERSGLTVDEMDTALKKLTVNLSKDSSEIEESLALMGLTAEQIKAAGPDQALNMIAEGMKGITDPSTKAKIAVDIFGKSGIKMVNVLGEGKDGMAQLAEEAHRVGYVMGTETLDASEQLNDQILNMKTSFKAIGNQIASKFMPMVTNAVVNITDFMVANRDTISGVVDSLVSVFGGLGPIASSLLPTMMNAVQGLGKILTKALSDAAPLLNKIGAAFAEFLPIVIDIAMTVGELLGPAFELLAPVLDIAFGLITGLLKAVSWLVRMLSSVIKPLINMLTGIFKFLKDSLFGIWDGIVAAAQFVWDGIVAVAKFAAGLIVAAWEGVGSFFSGLWEGIDAGANWLWDRMTEGAKAAVDMLKGVFDWFVGIQDKVGMFFGVDYKAQRDEFNKKFESQMAANGFPVGSQTQTIQSNSTTKNTLDVNFNNTPVGTSMKATGPTAPNINVNMGKPAWLQ
jgi:phage-related protein